MFYKFVAAAEESIRKNLCLPNNPTDDHLLAMSGVTVVNNEGGRTNDTKDLANTLSSLETVRAKGNWQQQNLFVINLSAFVIKSFVLLLCTQQV